MNRNASLSKGSDETMGRNCGTSSTRRARVTSPLTKRQRTPACAAIAVRRAASSAANLFAAFDPAGSRMAQKTNGGKCFNMKALSLPLHPLKMREMHLESVGEIYGKSEVRFAHGLTDVLEVALAFF